MSTRARAALELFIVAALAAILIAIVATVLAALFELLQSFAIAAAFFAGLIAQAVIYG